MNCPKCNVGMSLTNVNGIGTNICNSCEGVWLDSITLRTLLNIEEKAPSLTQIEESFKRSSEANSQLKCKSCLDQKLYQVEVRGVELDFCSNCKGLFFDKGELKLVLPKAHKQKLGSNREGYAESTALDFLFIAIGGLFGGGC